MKSTSVVVIPTYNESKNLRALVASIGNLNIPGLSMVVVDDNSPDGTGRVADELATSYPLRIIHRPYKLGLGKAYIAALKDVLSIENPEYIIHMDADFSHDPKEIPHFLEKIRNYDLVLGSRYIAGGKTANWNALRRWVSQTSNVYARAVLGLPFRDLTGGYKCYRSRVLESIDLNSVSSVGYNFQIEMTYKTYKHGFRITEIPITFSERKEGVSKFNLPIIIESFFKVLSIRFHEKK